MKPFAGLTVTVLAGFAAAVELADVYLLTSQPRIASRTPPRLPKEVARHILLQRASQDRYGSPLRDVPVTIDQETAISYINDFGRHQQPLFGSTESPRSPAQLTVLLEGITSENSKGLRAGLAKDDQHIAFSVSNPPSSAANNHLLADFKAAGVSALMGCTLTSAINPNDKSCWDGDSSVIRLDAQKFPEAIDTLTSNLERLTKFVSSGELEAAIILMPESSRASKLGHWIAPTSQMTDKTATADLRRRDSEAILNDGVFTAQSAPSRTPSTRNEGFNSTVPPCFASLAGCMSQTNNCSGHGSCINRYENDTKTKFVCFACKCVYTVLVNGTGEGEVGQKTVKWSGGMCQKKDISAPFWLITSVTIVLVGAVTFAIGLLFSVGEEKLPGVIGAGVSRTK